MVWSLSGSVWNGSPQLAVTCCEFMCLYKVQCSFFCFKGCDVGLKPYNFLCQRESIVKPLLWSSSLFCCVMFIYIYIILATFTPVCLKVLYIIQPKTNPCSVFIASLMTIRHPTQLQMRPLLVTWTPIDWQLWFWGSRSKASLTVGDLRPSLLIPQSKQCSFLHAWLSSLRKTDGLKFLSLFHMIFFPTLGSSACLCHNVHCCFNLKNQRSDNGKAICLVICWHKSCDTYMLTLKRAYHTVGTVWSKRSLIMSATCTIHALYLTWFGSLPMCISTSVSSW